LPINLPTECVHLSCFDLMAFQECAEALERKSIGDSRRSGIHPLYHDCHKKAGIKVVVKEPFRKEKGEASVRERRVA